MTRAVTITTDPVESAKAAHLRYVSDDKPGITRRHAGRGFVYLQPNGRRVRDAKTLERIHQLVIPPAWTDVWICPLAEGHLQATGRDDRGRKQYRYHDRWREVRDETKYGRMLAFGKVLPRIRSRVRRDLATRGLSKQKVLAVVVRLLESTYIRVGNEEYARDNHSFGLTTMQNRHVNVKGRTVRFDFPGKSGKRHRIEIDDERLAKLVRRCRDLPGQDLFQYIDEDGNPQPITSADVNDYLREISGEEITAKDFRTWAGTLLAVRGLQLIGERSSRTQLKAAVVRAIKAVAQQLGNTVAVCRKCYIHPMVLESYLEGALLRGLKRSSLHAKPMRGLRQEEAAMFRFLKAHLAADVKKSAA